MITQIIQKQFFCVTDVCVYKWKINSLTIIAAPNPQKLADMKFKFSATRHGVINWEEFGEKICGSFCTANEARECAENSANSSPNSSPRLPPKS